MVVKPIRLGVLRRVWSDAGGHHLCITALGAFDMGSAGDFLTEARLWKTVAPALGAAILDAGMPKPRAEVLVGGDVCAPAGRSVRSLVVNLELGPIRKRVAVFGRRWWRYGPDGPLMTRPEPFERIPLGWHNAFGGSGYAENPLGKGADARAAMSRRETAELPMVETPEALITGVEHRPAPAGLGPRAEDAPSRVRFAGTYDDAWLRDGFPGPGRGFDRRYYNAACPDQQTEAEFRGDEAFRITSMHAEHPDLRGRLPGFRVRAFARGGDAFQELPTRCDTVWMFPNALMGIALFRGGLAVADKEASDVPHAMLAYERLGDPRRSLAHYRAAFEERTDPKLAALKMFDERPIKPERLPAEVEGVEEERRALAADMARRQEQAREHAVANAFVMAGLPAPPAGLFSDDAPATVETPVVTPGEIERLEVDLVEMKAKVDALADDAMKESALHLAKAGREFGRALPHVADTRVRSLIQERLSQVSEPMSGRPVLSAVGVPEVPDAGTGAMEHGLNPLFERAGRLLAGAGGAGAAMPGQSGERMSVALRRARNRALGRVDEDDPIARAGASLAAQQAAAQGATASAGRSSGGSESASARMGANLFDSALRAIEGSDIATASDKRAKAAGLSSALADPRIGFFDEIAQRLTVAGGSANSGPAREALLADARSKFDEVSEKLDKLNAEGRRFSPEPMAPDEPLTERDAASLGTLALDLAGGGEGLNGRDLAGADLSGADLAGMNLEGIFLEQARLAGANFAGANLRRAVLTGADLTGADLSGADLTDSNLSGACLARVRLCDARLDRAQLFRSRLEGADLSGASLAGVSLIEAGLAGAQMVGAVVRDAQFLKCDLSAISLAGARLYRTVFVESDTTGFSAPAARFERCALIGVQGEDADLTGAEFVSSACIGNAKFARARMSGLVSTRSGWRGACLNGADLTAARLDETDLGETALEDACLRRASLRRTVLHKASAVGADFYGATMFEAQAQDADFTRASLHRANLYSADLTDARLVRCDLTGANLALTLMTKPADAG